MTGKPLPEGLKLARGVNPNVLTDEYEHWTVGDFIRMLADYPNDARMWVEVKPGRLAPVEIMWGTEGEVIL